MIKIRRIRRDGKASERVDAAVRLWKSVRGDQLRWAVSAADPNRSVQMPLPRTKGLNVNKDRKATIPRREDEIFRAGIWRALARLCIWMVAVMGFYLGVGLDCLLWRNTQQRRAVRLRRIIQRLGPTAIKIAQQASMRIDIIPHAYAFELSKLLDDVPPFKLKDAIEAIERSTKQKLAATFAAFDPTPIGSGSLACVYHAILHSGEEVAVKVRRPRAGDHIFTDLRALRLVLQFLELLFLLPQDFSKNILHELGTMLKEELNFSLEARHMELFARELKRAHFHYARAPRVYFDLSDRTVLVQEFVSGVWLTEVIAAVERQDGAALAVLRRRDIDPKMVARRLLLVSRFGGFESLLFHADLHPANVLVQDGNQIILVDFGACGSFTKHEREVWRRLLSAQNNNDVGRMAKAVLALIEPLPPIDVDEFTRKLESMFFQDLYATKSKHAFWWERTSANLWISFLSLAREYHMTLQLNTLRMIRITMLADTIALRLDNTIDNYHEYRRHEKDAGKRAKKQIGKRIRRLTGDRGFVGLEQLFDTGGDIVYGIQRLLSTNPIVNFALLAGKAAWTVDHILKAAGFLIGIEGTLTTILWTFCTFGNRSRLLGPAWDPATWDSSKSHFLMKLILDGQPLPKMHDSFFNVLRFVVHMPVSVILIILTVIWTVGRIHIRIDDAEVRQERGRGVF